jgi:hypothetical protein
MAVHRIDSWKRFKALVTELKPETVFYLSEPHPLRRPPLGLRLTFYHGKDIYVLIDYAEGRNLKKTGIPIINPEDAVRAEVREEDIRRFLAEELGNVKLVSLPPFMY